MNRLTFDRLAAQVCTDRQRLILHLTNQGWSSRRIAPHAACSHSTVLAELNKAVLLISQAHAEEQENAA